jgi:hypothetical protein
MAEALMYAAIGFLSAGMVALAAIPLVHKRAVRLTLRDLEGGLPISIAEVQAEKDALRAEFAMAVRRLEITNEQLRSKLASLMVRVSQKNDRINQLRRHLRTANEAPTVPVYERPARKREARIRESSIINAERRASADHSTS